VVFKPKTLNAENDKDKRSRVDSECLLHEAPNQTSTGEGDVGAVAQSQLSDNDATVVDK